MGDTVGARCPGQRGRNIPRAVVIQLLAESANRCAQPDCAEKLWVPVAGRAAVRVAEIAHILPAGETGPRAEDQIDEAVLVSEPNLIVLCPNTHTVVDGAPDAFPAETLRDWKAAHTVRLDEAFGVRRYADRRSARTALESALEENHDIWAHYGPQSQAAGRPDSEAHQVWLARVLDTVIPNNRTVRRILEANVGLLNAEECVTLRAFRRHETSFARRHLDGEFDPTGAVFPPGMNTVLLDEIAEEEAK